MKLKTFYNALFKRFGPQHWWPAETPFEVMVGAILTQNTSWSNVEKAIANIKILDLLSPDKLHEIDPDILARAIRPSGYFNVKTARLKSYLAWFMESYGGEISAMKRRPMEQLRDELLAVRGIGKETADSILLYAMEMPTFVVDAYTYRVLSRHGLIAEESGYDEIKEYCESNLPGDARLYNEFHALLVMVGKEFCRKVPKCDDCPLKRYLPQPL